MPRLSTFFLNDLARVHGLLPGRLRVRMFLVFLQIVLLAVVEVLGILSLSFLALSVAAPEKLLEQGMVRAVIQAVPGVEELIRDVRFFALLSSLAVVALAIVKNGVSALVGSTTSRLGESISLHAGAMIFRRYLDTPYLEHLSGDSTAMFQALSWKSRLGLMVVNLLQFYTYACISVALFLVLVSATPGAIILTLVVVGGIAFTLYRTLKKSIDRAGDILVRLETGETRTAMNAMNGIREVLIYRQQDVFYDSYESNCRKGMNSRAFLSVSPFIPPWALEIVGLVVIPTTLWIMITVHDASMADVTAVLTLIMLASWRILPLFNRSMSCLITVRNHRAMAVKCMERLEEIRDNPVPELPEPDPAYDFAQSVSLEDVSFRYPGAASDTLERFSLTIPKGRQVGIVGPSGAGKSTIAGILSGLIPPDSGRLAVDGRTLDPAGLAAYTMRVGYVPQSPYIMPGSIAENVAFSQWGRPCDEDKVWKACRMAALDIVETDARGIGIPVGERGAGLSGGQAQRVSIARVLYADPCLLILDEATSSLDSGTEQSIMETVDSLRHMVTTVIIAHRLSTVANCDQVVWVDKGRVVDMGTPREILPRYEQKLRESAQTPENGGACRNREGASTGR